MIVVSDTSPVIALIRINQIQLLPTLFHEVVIPSAVREELSLARFTEEELIIYKSCNWLIEKTVSDTVILNADLDKGEAEAIVLAKQLHADFLLIDETAGRKVAMNEGVRIIGVIGLLLVAKEKGLITEVKILIDALIAKSDFWISEKLYKNVLLQAGE
jgi:predicted nucleic acid-binding protein